MVKEFVERDVSGTSTNRPALKAMMRYLGEERGRIDYVVVHKLDRLARNRADEVAITNKFKEYGVRRVSTSENIDQTPGGMLMHGIMSSIAEFYSNNLANEVLKGMNQKAKAGGTPGKAPIGYLNVRNWTNGVESRTIEVNPERASLVQWAFGRYSQGDISVKQLAVMLKEKGRTTRPTKKRPARPLSVSHVHSILTNRYYLGFVIYKGVEYPGNHEPLISQDLFRKAQIVLAGRRQGERQNKHHHYLKSILWCGECGGRMNLQKPRSHTGHVYEYFVCNGRLSKHTNCHMPAVPVEFCEKCAHELYRQIQISKELMERTEEKVTAEVRQHYSIEDAERRKLESTKRELEAKQQKLFDPFYSDRDAINTAVMAQEQKDIDHRLTTVERQLSNMSKTRKDHRELV